MKLIITALLTAMFAVAEEQPATPKLAPEQKVDVLLVANQIQTLKTMILERERGFAELPQLREELKGAESALRKKLDGLKKDGHVVNGHLEYEKEKK